MSYAKGRWYIDASEDEFVIYSYNRRGAKRVATIHDMGRHITTANAVLIASAPETFEALLVVVKALSDVEDKEKRREALNIGRKAIRAAVGRPESQRERNAG